MTTRTLTPHAKTLTYALFGATLLHGANSYAAVSQSPLSLTIGVPPNMILTLDNSGSMRWGFAPDNINNAGGTRRGKSNAFNPIYYNPQATYAAPVTFDSSGNETRLQQSFTNARVNGYKESLGTVDLSIDYKANWTYQVNTTVPTQWGYSNDNDRLARNTEADFSTTTTISNSDRGKSISVLNTASNITFKIIRNSRNEYSCSATASHPNWPSELEADCNWTSNNRYNASLQERGVPAYYYVYEPSRQTNCSLANNNDYENCYTIRFITTSTEKSNFANWYSFYRNRALATISAANLAFYNLSPTARLSWQSLAGCSTFSGNRNDCNNNKFQSFSAEHKRSLYNWMQNIEFGGGTPLQAAMKRAGEFYRTETPWQNVPYATSGNSSENTYACRAAYHIVMTDGIWGGSVDPDTTYQQDGANISLPDRTAYTGQAPYRDENTKSVADLAMHYWATDLRTSLNNKVPAYIPFKSGDDAADYWDPRNDPATWQHMTNFVMGLGLTQSLSINGIPWTGSTHSGSGYTALKQGTANWPSINSDAGKVYDLWHAAINSRGEFFSVDSPEAMVQAFADILSRIADRKSTAARPAINSGQVIDDTVTTVSYQTSYASDANWSGDVKRFDKSWDNQTKSFVTQAKWTASEVVPAWESRKIFIAGGGGASNMQRLTATTAGSSSYGGSTLLAYLSNNPETGTSDTLAEQRISYLRGDRAGEGTTFRPRSGLLGDFYSSSPAAVSKARYLPSVANRIENNTAYTTFARDAQLRSPRLYVGGNDGMLHGFNATSGVEEFAFIPSAVFPKLNKLTGANYSHEFYVEGSPVVGDVYDATTSQWRTILVGTLKAGGKSVFALDITTPGSEKLLWQFDDNSITTNNAVKMGYSFSQPTIARLHTGKWAVVFGNGYEAAGNSNGKAALFIIDAMQGTLVRSLEVQGTNGEANGLSTPRLADINSDGVADYAYAGDLQGNMWRFDLLRSAGSRDENAPFKVTNDVQASVFRVGYGGRALFSATATDSNPSNKKQPITAPPSLLRHPTGTGHLVVFGTGRFFDSGDKEGDKSMSQTVYGIWDKQTRGETGTNAKVTVSTLQEQELTTGLTASDGTTSKDARVISNNSVRWQAGSSADEPAQNGWYLNLVKNDGEMVVESMSQLGNTLLFQSLVPNDDPCGDGASNWTYAINPFTGGRTAHNAFDYVTSENVPVSSVQQNGEGGITLGSVPGGDGGSGSEVCTGQECIDANPGLDSVGRQSWRRVDEKE